MNLPGQSFSTRKCPENWLYVLYKLAGVVLRNTFFFSQTGQGLDSLSPKTFASESDTVVSKLKKKNWAGGGEGGQRT